MKTILRLFFLLLSIFLFYCSFFRNSDCINAYGTWTTGLILYIGILIMCIIPFYPDGMIDILKKQQAVHIVRTTLSTATGVLGFFLLTTLTAILVSAGGMMYFHNAHNEAAVTFFSLFCGCNFLLAGAVGLMGFIAIVAQKNTNDGIIRVDVPLVGIHHTFGGPTQETAPPTRA